MRGRRWAGRAPCPPSNGGRRAAGATRAARPAAGAALPLPLPRGPGLPPGRERPAGGEMAADSAAAGGEVRAAPSLPSSAAGRRDGDGSGAGCGAGGGGSRGSVG